ncbi:MAG: helix-turn-helix domain-containing protein [Patescibacteria group bacterium]|jgi:predicted transcriptional regulator
MLTQELQQLGLNEKEAKVYLSALEFGPTTVAKLAQKSGVKRTSIYEFLADMVARGLIVATVVGKRTLYDGIDPEGLNILIDRQQKIIKELTPELLLLTKQSPQKPKIRFYEGVEGSKYVFNDTLNQPDGAEILFIGTWAGTFDVVPQTFVNQYIIQRKKKHIKVRSIVPYDKDAVEGKKKDAEELRETIIVPESKLPIKTKINIYGNKIAILSFGDEKISLIIESQQISDTLKAIFNLLWENLKQPKA